MSAGSSGARTSFRMVMIFKLKIHTGRRSARISRGSTPGPEAPRRRSTASERDCPSISLRRGVVFRWSPGYPVLPAIRIRCLDCPKVSDVRGTFTGGTGHTARRTFRANETSFRHVEHHFVYDLRNVSQSNTVCHRVLDHISAVHVQ